MSAIAPRPELAIRPFRPEDEPAVIELWRRCDLLRPWNDPRKDIRRKLAVRPDLFLVAESGEGSGRRVVAAVMAGYDGHRGWMNYLAVDPDCQRGGVGRRMVEDVEQRLLAAGCPKVNVQIRATNAAVVEFYRRLGYAVDEAISMGKRLEHDDRA